MFENCKLEKYSTRWHNFYTTCVPNLRRTPAAENNMISREIRIRNQFNWKHYNKKIPNKVVTSLQLEVNRDGLHFSLVRLVVTHVWYLL